MFEQPSNFTFGPGARWDDLVNQAQRDREAQWNNKDSFDPFSGGSTSINGKGAQIYLQPDAPDMWNSANFNVRLGDEPENHMSRLFRNEDGTVGRTTYQIDEGVPWGAFAVMAAPFAAAGLQSLGVLPGAGTAAGEAATGGLGSLGAGVGEAAAGDLIVDTAGMGLTGPGGIGSAGSLAGQGIAGWGAGAEGAAAAAGLGSLAPDQGANEWAKLLRQDAAPPGSLLNTGLPTIDTTSGLGDLINEKLGNIFSDPKKLMKLGQALQGGLGSLGGGGAGGGGGGGGGGYDPNFKPREPVPYTPMKASRPVNQQAFQDPYWSRNSGVPNFFAPVQYSYAQGGPIKKAFGVDEEKMKAIRKHYRSRAEVAGDIGRPGSHAMQMGIRSADDPTVIEAFSYTTKQGPGKKAKNASPFKKFGQGFANGGEVGGLASLGGDGMSDSVGAVIDGQQPAKLSSGEYVVTADAVSHLGNGDTQAGVQVLDNMVARIRKARTGTPQQAPRINPAKFVPT